MLEPLLQELDAAQAKADKLVDTLTEAAELADALENAVAIDCDDFADRIAAVKALATDSRPNQRIKEFET